VLEYIYNYPKKSSNNLCYYKEGFLAGYIAIIAFLIQPSLQHRDQIIKVKLLNKDIILYSSLLPIFRAILNYLVHFSVHKLLDRSHSTRASAFRASIAKNTANS
jgi:hypothetical protein